MFAVVICFDFPVVTLTVCISVVVSLSGSSGLMCVLARM